MGGFRNHPQAGEHASVVFLAASRVECSVLFPHLVLLSKAVCHRQGVRWAMTIPDDLCEFCL